MPELAAAMAHGFSRALRWQSWARSGSPLFGLWRRTYVHAPEPKLIDLPSFWFGYGSGLRAAQVYIDGNHEVSL